MLESQNTFIHTGPLAKGRVLVTGACGQVGTELCLALRARLGAERVLAADIRPAAHSLATEPFVLLDVVDAKQLEEVLVQEQITEVYHLAALLSARGETDPMLTWQLNVEATHKLLDLAQRLSIQKVFIPSSIAVFGPEAPKKRCPQQPYLLPKTMYGVSKVACEHLISYYHCRYGLDVRSLRYPGIVSAKQVPGGGTTDYAVEVIKAALVHKPYTCFLAPHTRLPMMHISDAIAGTLALMEAPREKLGLTDSYNITAISFTPEELAAAVRVHFPQLTLGYAPDYRQEIATSWPEEIDDSVARKEWNWRPRYGLSDLVAKMIAELKEQD